MRIAAAQINPIVGALSHNRKKIIHAIEESKKKGADLIVFPEMALTGYPPEDLLVMPDFVKAACIELYQLAKQSKGCTVIVGGIRENPSLSEKNLCNTAAIFSNGELIGFQDKALLPDYDVFSERRYFEPASQTALWGLLGKRIGITICEDIWQHADEIGYSSYRRDPVLELQTESPDLLINISCSPYYVDRPKTRLKVGKAVVKTLKCPLLLCNQIGGNDSLLFDGHSYFMDANGDVLALAKGFQEDLLIVDTDSLPKPLQPTFDTLSDLFDALVMGLKDYFSKLGFKKACLGLSGGIDSALVACIATAALGKENVQALSMPSRYTSPHSIEDAEILCKNLGISLKTVSIEEPFDSFLHTLQPHFAGKKEDITEENLQSRIRGMILMAFSNKCGFIILCTGNKSETAMGYATLYGDTVGALGVLSDVSKNLVYALARWVNREREIIPKRTIERAPSAELRPNQKDSDTMPEYSIIDKVIEGYIEEHLSIEEIATKYGLQVPVIKDLVKRIHLNEYKRRQSPPALRVTKKAFAVGRRFPIVQHWNVHSG